MTGQKRRLRLPSCYLNVSAFREFSKRGSSLELFNLELPQGFERSAAIEPFDRTQGRLLERLERAFGFRESDLFTSKKPALSLETALFIQSSIAESMACAGPTCCQLVSLTFFRPKTFAPRRFCLLPVNDLPAFKANPAPLKRIVGMTYGSKIKSVGPLNSRIPLSSRCFSASASLS